MDDLRSAIWTGCQLAFAILIVVTLSAGVWVFSTYIGRPLGVVSCKFVDNFVPESVQREKNYGASAEKREYIAAGCLGLFLCSIGLIYEVSILVIAMERSPVIPWELNVLNVALLPLKASIEGLISLGVLAGVVKVLGLSS